MKKLLAALVILPALLLAACAPTRPMVIPMPGSNIAQLQPELLVREAAAFLGVAPDELFLPQWSRPRFTLTREFDWSASPSIPLVFALQQAQYQSRLRAHGGNFIVDSPYVMPVIEQPLLPLLAFLHALRYLPQDDILALYPAAEGFFLSLTTAGEIYTPHTELFYNRYGIIEELHGDYYYITFVLTPMHAVEPGAYQGAGISFILFFAFR
ncbi:MAG: hypothetical protein FWB76_03690 [Oscillospiraceae bacterium]|nr:hypothetical protein [Oscillospiraceae bacterium]